MKTRIVIAAAALMAASSAFAAPINTAAEVVQVSRSAQFARADLQSEVGAKAAYARLRTLARSVCTDSSDFRSLWNQQEAQECAAKALDAAVRDLGSPAVGELHNAKFN